MRFYTKHRSLIHLALGGLCLSVLSVGIWIVVNEGAQSFTVGEITAVATRANSFTLATPTQVDLTVRYTATTTIERGRVPATASELAPGEFVQVSGRASAPQIITAEHIRFIRPPSARGPFHDDH